MKLVADNYLYSSLLPSGLLFVLPNIDPDKSLICLLLQNKHFSPIVTGYSGHDKPGCDNNLYSCPYPSGLQFVSPSTDLGK